jgi:gluconokinase
MNCIITIELGTNAVRVFAFDLNGAVIGSSKGYYPTFHTQPDYSEQDPEQIFITMLYVLKNLLNEKIHPQKYKVVSVCFSSAMHSLLCVDKHGTPLGNAMTWADNRAKKEALQVKESPMANAMYNATGTPIHPMSPVFKIAWLNKNDKERYKRAGKFLSIKSYIIYQLTGEYVIDHSLACATGMFNIKKIKWEEQALNLAGISEEKLPVLMPVFTRAGSLKKAYQNTLGLTDEVRIIIGSSDGCMATLGAGIWNSDKATITIEDSSAVRVVGNKVLHDEKRRIFNYMITDDWIVSGGPSNNGGVIFEWFAKQFGDFNNAYDIETCMSSLLEQAAKVKTGADGLLFLPYLLGERAPLWNADARGVYFGINIKHEREHFIRAAIEGILYEVYSIGKMLNDHRSINSLSVNGSFATIPFCAQIISDMFNKPVSVTKNTNSVSMGAFLLAATELGIYRSLDEAAKQIEVVENYMPMENSHKIYMKYFDIFESLSHKLSDEFAKISALQ